MIKEYSRYKALALVCLALLFLPANNAFAQSPVVEYLCELGKNFYSLGKVDDALTEFNKALIVDPANKTAKEYISKIFKESPSAQESAPALSKTEAMDLALDKLKSKKEIRHSPYASVKNLTEEDKKEGLKAHKIFEESRSAKQPGRPYFNELMYGSDERNFEQLTRYFLMSLTANVGSGNR